MPDRAMRVRRPGGPSWPVHTLICALVIAAIGTPTSRVEAQGALQGCRSVVPAHIGNITGLPPHQSWRRPLPNTPKYSWLPFATDSGHVLMAELDIGQRTGPAYIPLATVNRAEHIQLAPKAEYPHWTIERMRIEYPWIVGIRATQQPPDDWKLFAANVVTGKQQILDHGNGNNAQVTREYPDFALDAHRVMWDDAAYPERQSAAAAHKRFLWNRLDLYNLDTGRKTVVASTTDGMTLYMQPTLWGNTVVWVRITEPPGKDINPTWDLVLGHLGSRTVVNLTHNYRSGISSEPSLWRHYLLFKQSGTPYQEGDVLLWDLSKGHFPLWRKPGSALLETRDGEMPLWDGGVAWWQAQGQATFSVYIPGTGKVWTFQYGPHVDLKKYYKYAWYVQSTGEGGNLVIERDRSGNRVAPAYYLWHIAPPAVCR